MRAADETAEVLEQAVPKIEGLINYLVRRTGRHASGWDTAMHGCCMGWLVLRVLQEGQGGEADSESMSQQVHDRFNTTNQACSLKHSRTVIRYTMDV